MDGFLDHIRDFSLEECNLEWVQNATHSEWFQVEIDLSQLMVFSRGSVRSNPYSHRLWAVWTNPIAYRNRFFRLYQQNLWKLRNLNLFRLIVQVLLMLLVQKINRFCLMKNHALIFRDCLFLLICIGALTLSLFLKLSPWKSEPWFIPDSTFYSEVVLYLHNFTMWPSMEYSCHVWTGSGNCFLDMLDKPQKRVCREVDSILAASVEPLNHGRNMASQSLFFRSFFGRC